MEAIVLYSSPGISHLASMVELGKLIVSRYAGEFSVIILLTNGPFDVPATASYIDRVSLQSSAHPISFRRFSYLPFTQDPSLSRMANLFDFYALNASNFRQSLLDISKSFSVRAIILDIFLTSAFPVARSLGIPTFYYVSLSAAALAAILYLPTLHEQTSQSFKDLPDTFFSIPGFSAPLRATHLMEPMLDRDDRGYEEALRLSLDLRKCDGILVNTFDALEPEAVKAVANGECVTDRPCPPLYTIGPLIADAEEDDYKHECFSWLDQQPRRSVVFLCFGSRGSFCREQLREMAKGLEGSGVRFLWAMKSPAADAGRKEIGKEAVAWDDFDLEEILPEGFMGRTKGRGMVVKSWVPQRAVLGHGSVGGFVTHSGWTSVLEAVTAGVPMAAWPLHAEQHVNKAALVEDMKLAVALEQRAWDGFVSGAELEMKLKRLMESEEGREVRERIEKVREMAVEAWKEEGSGSGSSARALHKLAHIWRRPRA